MIFVEQDYRLRGKVFEWDGKKIMGYCKVCGKFTLDTVTVLCASCRLDKFFNSIYVEGGDENGVK